jgi:DNA-directed RNA polymerase specialized sigma24 family protein
MCLGREFQNSAPVSKTVVSRLSRGWYKGAQRSDEPSIIDVRGPMVRSIEKAQTFLSTAAVDELVALYREGLSLAELGRRFSIHTQTVVRHLVRRSVPLPQRSVGVTDVPEAVRLDEGGLTLMEVGLQLGVSDKAVKTALARANVTIRPKGRRTVPVTV